MTKLYVTEYATCTVLMGGRLVQVPLEPPLAEQVVDYSGGVASSTAFNAQTEIVRLQNDSICSTLFGTAPTATTSKSRKPADTIEYHGVPRGASYKVSAITNS